MSSTSSEHHLLDMTILPKLSLFRTELIIFLPLRNPCIGSSSGIWVYTPLYSVLHCDSGRLRVTLIGSSSSTNPRTTVDSNSSLLPVSLPLLVFSSLAAVLTQASIRCAYVPFIIGLFPKSQSHPLSSYHPLDVRQIFLVCKWHHITPISSPSVAPHCLYEWLFRFLYRVNKTL